MRSALCHFVDAGSLEVVPPNDVLLNGKKVAGLLCEQSLRPGKAGTTAVVGVGVNVNLDPEVLGPGLRRPATSLSHELGYGVEIADVIDRCVEALLAALSG